MTVLNDTIKRIVPQDRSFREKSKERLDQLTMPHWALGRLMDLSMDLAGITRSLRPPVDKRVVVVMAGDHGVVREGVTLYPQEVTRQMVLNFVNGGAGINAIARVSHAQVIVVNMGVLGDFSEPVELWQPDLTTDTALYRQHCCGTRDESGRSNSIIGNRY